MAERVERFLAWFELRQFLITRMSPADFIEFCDRIDPMLSAWLREPRHWPNPAGALDARFPEPLVDEILELLVEGRKGRGRYSAEVNAELFAFVRKIRQSPPDIHPKLREFVELEYIAGRKVEPNSRHDRSRASDFAGVRIGRAELRDALAEYTENMKNHDTKLVKR
jgi:hypothetical protein